MKSRNAGGVWVFMSAFGLQLQTKTNEDNPMIKVFRLLAICTIGAAFATSSIAWAQSYTTVDYPGAVATTLNGGPNPQGTSVGSWTDSLGVTHGFTLTKHGVFTSFDPPTSTLTVPNFISPQGVIVGGYNDAGGVSHGFILDGGQYTTLDFPGAAGTTLTGLNPSGEMSGYSCSDPACNTPHSFVVSKRGVFTSFDPPGATRSWASSVNPSGAVVGAYSGGGVRHGYLLYHGTFVTIDFPGGIFTFAGGNNPEGDIVGEYVDASGNAHSFLLSHGVYTSFDPPGALASDATGINPGGVIVGLFVDPSFNAHGYIRTP
jgi:hypothetical protein